MKKKALSVLSTITMKQTSTQINSFLSAVITLAGLFCLTNPASGQMADSPWSGFRHDLRHTGRSSHAGPTEASLGWIFESNSAILSSPSIDTDGTIYFLSGNRLNALNPDGAEKWHLNLPAGSAAGVRLQSSPAIGNGGKIYVMTFDYLHAVNPDGSLEWSFLTKDGTRTHRNSASPVVDANGAIYFVAHNGLSDGYLYALNPNGSEKWRYQIGISDGSPAIGSDGTIIVRANTSLYAMNSDSSLKWQTSLKAGGESSPAIDDNGVIYIGAGHNSAGFLCAINPDGTEKWTFTIPGKRTVVASPAIGAAGEIYFGAHDKKFYALNPDGSLKWSFETGSLITSSAAIDAEGTIYFGSWDNKLYALNPDGTEKWSYETGGDVISSPSIDENGTLFVGSNDRKLYAFVRISAGENPDLTISAIDFEPPTGAIVGENVNVIPVVSELTNKQAATAEVFLYLNDKSNLLASKSVQVFAGRSAHPKFSWDTQGLAPGRYDLIAVVRNSNPSENDTTNNEFIQNYQILVSLQSRIDAAQPGDTVWVEPGAYKENIRLKNGVVVKSLLGPKETMIDGDRNGVTVDASDLSRSAVLDGFTVRNGKGISGRGGIDLDLSSATIINNIIEGNEPSGIWHRGFQTALIEANLFINNKVRGFDGNNSQAILINNTFVNNPVGVKSIGFFVPSPKIVNCIFWDNGDDLEFSARATYSDIKDGNSGFGNISVDPEFVDPGNGNFRLASTSPCIDGGEPTITDPDDSRSDMGAYWFDQGGGKFGAPQNLQASPADNNGKPNILLTWDTPPPVLEVSADSLFFDTFDLGWAFFLRNTGLGRLQWTVSSEQAWLAFTPRDGVAMLGNGQIAAFASRKKLLPGEYKTNITISSNGGEKSIPVRMIVGNTPEPGKWSGSNISFSVSETMRSASGLRFSLSSGNSSYRFNFNGSVEIAEDQSFTFGSGSAQISGKFDTRNSASGTYQVSFPPSPTGTWSATWQDDSQAARKNSISSVTGHIDAEIRLIAGYNIYRTRTSGSYDTVFAKAPGQILSFNDTTVVMGEDYYYRVAAHDQNDATSEKSNEVGPVTPIITSVQNEQILPATFQLDQNYPNPFNPETTISYQLPRATEVKLEIFNLLGQRVATLVEKKQPAGYYAAQWDGRDELGQYVASGVYLYRIHAGEFSEVRKLSLIR